MPDNIRKNLRHKKYHGAYFLFSLSQIMEFRKSKKTKLSLINLERDISYKQNISNKCFYKIMFIMLNVYNNNVYKNFYKYFCHFNFAQLLFLLYIFMK